MISTAMTEDQLQKLVAEYLTLALPDGSVFHHSPNEGTRHVSFKMKLKSFGTRSGWPDLEIFCPSVRPIFIELKRPDQKGRAKGVLSHNQRLLKEQFENLGVHWAMCKSLDDVVNFLSPLVRLKGGDRYVDMVRGK